MRKLSKTERNIKKLMTPKDYNNRRKRHGLPMHRMTYLNGKRYKFWHYGVYN